MINFKFSPSLLDAFQQYLDAESLYEKFYGFSDRPRLTLQEYEDEQFRSLIDKINRIPFDSEAMDKGSVFNEIVDCIIMGVKSTRDDIFLQTKRITGQDYCVSYIEGKKGDRTFNFDIGFCKDTAEYFKDSLCQTYTEGTIETDGGTVLLYGYPDYVRGDMVYDMKTTSKYEFGKYSKYWQQHLYPYTLIQSGKCTDIRAFEFTAFQMRGGNSKNPFISGDKYPEVYVYEHEKSEQKLRNICNQFIEFLTNNKSLIRDEKIFGGEKKAS